ncbi:MAG: DUF386 domain-containing protein [Candidatus Omnitrophica bacterium]|nr:DUF386 domain-containing protein [Candidatus Omnitrophota bacterium]
MIVDRFSNLQRYALPMTDKIVAFLDKDGPAVWPAGETEILGRELFVRPSEYLTRAPAEGKFETHRVYADLQYVVSGAEVMQVALEESCVPVAGYDEAGDCQFFRAQNGITDLLVPAGHFAVFFPGEAHRPCCQVDGHPAPVRKLVFKIRIK